MTVRVEREADGVGLIVLDRPPANTFDYAGLQELGAAIDDLRCDDGVRAVVLTSASPRFFCAGADVAAFRTATPGQRAMISLLGHETFRRVERTPKVFVAAIAGHAASGGLELALACDLRFAARGSYQLRLAEVNLGLFPGMGATQRLPRLVGLPTAMDLIATGAPVSPERALEIGLVDRLFDDAGACVAGAIDYCARLTRAAPEGGG